MPEGRGVRARPLERTAAPTRRPTLAWAFVLLGLAMAQFASTLGPVAHAGALAGGASTADAGACPTPDARGWAALSVPEGPARPDPRIGARLLSVAAGRAAGGELYGGGFRGLYRSGDCGRTWEQVLVPLQASAQGEGRRVSDDVQAVAVGREGTIYAGGQQALYSDDGGFTWRTTRAVNIASVTASPSVPGLAYAQLFESLIGTFRTLDSGRTWERRCVSGFTVLAVDSRDPDVVHAAELRCPSPLDCSPPGRTGVLVRSRDGAASFAPIAEFPGGISALALSDDDSRFWLATDAGKLYVSYDRGATWGAPRPLPATGHLLGLAANPFDVRSVFALTNAGELWAYRDPVPVGLPRTGGGPPDSTMDDGGTLSSASGDG